MNQETRSKTLSAARFDSDRPKGSSFGFTEEGSAAVELALALPIIMLLVFGLLQFVMLINAKTVLEQAAYEAARTAAVKDGDDEPTARAQRIAAVVPRGAGFLKGRPRVKVRRGGGSVHVEVRGELLLLPFIRQAFLVGGGDGAVDIIVKAKVKDEPYLGY